MTHSFVEASDDEVAAFTAFATDFPAGTVLATIDPAEYGRLLSVSA